MLHSCPHCSQRNVSTSGLCGITRRPLVDAHSGQMIGKTSTQLTLVFHNWRHPTISCGPGRSGERYVVTSTQTTFRR